jgi:hypothetical protein
MRQRGERIERSFAHLYDTGGMRRTYLRGHEREGFVLTEIASRIPFGRASTASAPRSTEIPALIRSEADSIEVALIENLQRENLSAIEEAEALLKLKQARQFTDQALAKIIGKSRQSVNDSLILNDLPESIKAECQTSGIWSKSQPLEVVRAGDDQKKLATCGSLRRGRIRTIRDMPPAKTR